MKIYQKLALFSLPAACWVDLLKFDPETDSDHSSPRMSSLHTPNSAFQESLGQKHKDPDASHHSSSSASTKIEAAPGPCGAHSTDGSCSRYDEGRIKKLCDKLDENFKNVAANEVEKLRLNCPGPAWNFIDEKKLVEDAKRYRNVRSNRERMRFRAASRISLLVIWHNVQSREKHHSQLKQQLDHLEASPDPASLVVRKNLEAVITSQELKLHDLKLAYEEFHTRHLAFCKTFPDRSRAPRLT